MCLLITVPFVNTVCAEQLAVPSITVPQVHVPAPPQMPKPPLPTLPDIRKQTDAIAHEIETQTAGDAKESFTSNMTPQPQKPVVSTSQDGQGNTQITNNSEVGNQDAANPHSGDKISNNPYLQGDKQNGTANSVPTGKEPQLPLGNNDKNQTAKEVLKTHFTSLMFYLFGKTVFIALAIWLGLIFVYPQMSMFYEILTFAFFNIIGGGVYLLVLQGQGKGIYTLADYNFHLQDILLILSVYAIFLLSITFVMFVIADYFGNEKDKQDK